MNTMKELEILQEKNAHLEGRVKSLHHEINQLNANYEALQKSYTDLNEHYLSIRRNPCVEHHLLRYEFTLHPALFFSITQEAQRQLIMDVLRRAMREMQEVLLPSKF